MLKVASYAKINFVLDVLGKRPDGYHELAMVMQSVSLCDILTLESTDSPGIKLTCNKPITGNTQDNLAYRAAALMAKDFPQIQGLQIELEKNIPIAAGLAGGSADCAGVIYGINQLYKLNLVQAELADYANQLGSDTAFCLQGGTMLCQGRGEILTALPPVPTLYGILLKPPFPVSTAQVYTSIPKGIAKHASQTKIQTFQAGKITAMNLAQNLINDLYEYAVKIQPQLPEYLNELQATKPIACQMSGSGPTIFAFYENQLLRDTALKQLSSMEVYAIQTTVTGQRIL